MSLTARITDLAVRTAQEFAKVPYSNSAETISALWNFATAPTILGNAVWHAGNFNPATKIDKVPLTDNAIVRADGTSGAVQNSGVIIDDGGNVSGVGSIFIKKITGYDTGYKNNWYVENENVGFGTALQSKWYVDGVAHKIQHIFSGADKQYIEFAAGNQTIIGNSGNSFVTIENTGATTFSNTVNSTGYKQSGTDLKLSPFLSGSQGSSGTILTSSGASTDASWKTVNEVIGGNALTSGYLPYWDGGKLVNSVLFTNGTNISIGTSVPDSNNMLEINGAVSSIAGIYVDKTRRAGINSPNANDLEFRAGNVDGRFRIYGTGIIQIPNLASSSTRLVTASADGTLGAIAAGSEGYVMKWVSGAPQWASAGVTEVYKGTWSAATNTPTLADGTGTAGWYYICSAAGTVNFGSGNITFAVGDRVSYNGSVWQFAAGVGYNLQAATASVLGGVKIGSGVTVQADGTISVSTAYDASGTASSTMSTHTSTYNHANYDTAYSWGNHATAGYTNTRIRGNAYSYLTGDVTIQQGDNISISQSGSVITVSMPVAFLTSINSTMVTDALGFTPIAASYLTSNGYATQTWVGNNYSPLGHTHAYDNYQGWNIQANGGAATTITSGATVNFAQGTNVSISRSGNTITVNAPAPYSAGIATAVGDGTWSVITNNSSNWDTAYSNMGKVRLQSGSTYGEMDASQFQIIGGVCQLIVDTSLNPSSYKPVTNNAIASAVLSLQGQLDGKENTLGNPSTNGYVLSSTTAGVRSWVAMSGSGTSDHGSLTGLGDDDHSQYYNQTRGDARYAQKAGSTAQDFSAQKLTLSGGWAIEISGGVLVITYNGTAKASLNSLGQLKANEIDRGGA